MFTIITNMEKTLQRDQLLGSDGSLGGLKLMPLITILHWTNSRISGVTSVRYPARSLSFASFFHCRLELVFLSCCYAFQLLVPPFSVSLAVGLVSFVMRCCCCRRFRQCRWMVLLPCSSCCYSVYHYVIMTDCAGFLVVLHNCCYAVLLRLAFGALMPTFVSSFWYGLVVVHRGFGAFFIYRVWLLSMSCSIPQFFYISNCLLECVLNYSHHYYNLLLSLHFRHKLVSPAQIEALLPIWKISVWM